MMARRTLLATATLLVATPVLAQQARRGRRNDPLPLPPPPPPPEASSFGEPAPVPNNDIEAPRSRTADSTAPQVNPVLIDPDDPQIGTQRDRSSLQSREDRLLRQPAPGARLRLPFAY
ncbi:hypothetical protein GXW78_15740 [Roseomonas terrae]|jgi:hypothetical protein|uniref:Uncharacterized protein n=1 Tax=Neoroseomonas terrae TaxID=424799 RepID=A0ABS5EJB6_9PROT|nr:hypothetical protein [Neoroseomonas terrae]MBR0651124.1 hypothetical protein [Neoroseomonas terrae]